MQYKEFILAEIDKEMPKTRKMLERVPEDKYDWKPHIKSMSLGELSSHISQLTGFAITMAKDETFDFAKLQHAELRMNADLLATFDDLLEKTKEAIRNTPEEDFQKQWAMVVGDKVIAAMPKWDAIQNIYLHHIIHHRAQLGVYLRLLDIPVPGIYGPSADER